MQVGARCMGTGLLLWAMPHQVLVRGSYCTVGVVGVTRHVLPGTYYPAQMFGC